jgi:cellulose synthase/poly-beta-1,6-N-acetylglucosamine synthase-like glycosyltransferase
MTNLFLTGGMLCLLLALHPFTTYPLSLRLMRRFVPPRPLRIGADPARQSFAVCLCAYNEERVIEAKMQNLLALREREPGLEILVYVDAAGDRTAEILKRYADRITLHVSPERHGKTHGMNLLVSKARASILVFTDANVMLDLEALDRLRRYFTDPAVGCVCGNLVYTNGGDSVTAASGSLYWRLEEGIKKLEEATGSIMGADGSLFAIRRALHHPPPDHIIDDMYVSFRILCDGYRIVQATDVRAYEESVTSPREEFRRKVRIACQAFNVHRLIWPRLKRLDRLTLYKYVSHKLIRWLSIYFLVLAGLAFEGALLAAGLYELALGLAAGGLGMLAAGHYAGIKPFAQLTDILAALLGAGLGVWQSLRGNRYQTWTPAASIRRS